MIRWHATNVAAFAGNDGWVRLNNFGRQISVTSAAAPRAAVNLVADQQGWLFYAARGMRSIVLLVWG